MKRNPNAYTPFTSEFSVHEYQLNIGELMCVCVNIDKNSDESQW